MNKAELIEKMAKSTGLPKKTQKARSNHFLRLSQRNLKKDTMCNSSDSEHLQLEKEQQEKDAILQLEKQLKSQLQKHQNSSQEKLSKTA